MFRYVNMMLAIEKNKDETDAQTEQRLREQLVKKGFSICYHKEYKENYNA